jgi:hypothetical protein
MTYYYLGFVTLTSYSPAACASGCNSLALCSSFNICKHSAGCLDTSLLTCQTLNETRPSLQAAVQIAMTPQALLTLSECLSGVIFGWQELTVDVQDVHTSVVQLAVEPPQSMDSTETISRYVAIWSPLVQTNNHQADHFTLARSSSLVQTATSLTAFPPFPSTLAPTSATPPSTHLLTAMA